ncbi:hypothetical protein [Streptomyces sp. NPDC059861]|uniref:hypothetical protein n=1 Tax=Streptomyces sp. NPDC059861 TaxID=3346974 RepID=UPI00364EA9FF
MQDRSQTGVVAGAENDEVTAQSVCVLPCGVGPQLLSTEKYPPLGGDARPAQAGEDCVDDVLGLFVVFEVDDDGNGAAKEVRGFDVRTCTAAGVTLARDIAASTTTSETGVPPAASRMFLYMTVSIWG